MKTIYHIHYALSKDGVPHEIYVSDRELAERIAHKRHFMNFGEDDAVIREISVGESFDELPQQLRKALATDLSKKSREEKA